MAAFNHGAFIKALRVRRGSIPADLYADIMAALESGLKADGRLQPQAASVPHSSDVPWVSVARSQLGLKEIPGPKHNPKILEYWAAAKASWFKDDETPWCGGFMAYVMVKCGIVPPKEAPRAISWATWGKECAPQLGAVGVKKRVGGNHVFLIVGITADREYYKALGGNQGNMVSIIDIKVEEVTAIRWPSSMPTLHITLPIMPRGTTGGSEA
jgi:uncharacterized protein (TIGR02594 family)